MRSLTTFALLAALLVSSRSIAAESVIETPGPEGALVGTMLAPASPNAPVVLIVPGSGPTDRDGNNPMGLKPSTYRLLAEGLLARDIATVRIDKRGLFGSHAAVADPNAVTVNDYAADVHAWASAIRARTGVACVWVLGHSEGGLVALVAAQNSADICGLILVAAAGRPLGDVLREQLKSNPANAPVLEQAEAAIAQLEAGKRVDTTGMNPALLPLFRPDIQGFLINGFSFDPAKLIAAVRMPVLIVQGNRDIQVGVSDAERLQQALPAAKLAMLPDTNHVLKAVSSDDRAANIATYADPKLPLAPGTVDAIANFVAASRQPGEEKKPDAQSASRQPEEGKKPDAQSVARQPDEKGKADPKSNSPRLDEKRKADLNSEARPLDEKKKPGAQSVSRQPDEKQKPAAKLGARQPDEKRKPDPKSSSHQSGEKGQLAPKSNGRREPVKRAPTLVWPRFT